MAEQALSLAYQAPEVFARIRSPLSYSSEGSSRKPEEDGSPEEKQERDSDFVPVERVAKEARFFEQVIDIRPRIDALFGKGSAEPFNEFLKVRWEIIGAARMLSQLHQRTHFRTQQQQDEHFEKTDKYEKVIWSQPDEDQIEKRLASAVSSIESFAAPLLKSHFRPRKAT